MKDSLDLEARGNQQSSLHINVSNAAVEFMDMMKGDHGISYTETVRRGLAIYKMAIDEQEKGNSLAIYEANGEIRELRLLF